MGKAYWRFYFITLGILLALSAYPLVMGIRIIVLWLLNGGIRPEEYARYVIPYTAICLAILITAGMHPVISRLKRMTTLVATVLGLGLFVGIELFMESITIKGTAIRLDNIKVAGDGANVQTAVDWQLFSCVGTPAAKQAFMGAYSDAYKIHYFLVSFVMIALIIGLVYGYGKLLDGGSRVPFCLQLGSAILLVGLCVFANITGFFRDAGTYLSPFSAFLTGAFFIVLGASFGIYAGSYMLGRRRVLSLLLPAVAAILVCSIMYLGEVMLLNGELYRFGQSDFFKGLPHIILAPLDILIILASGMTTALVLKAAGRKYRHGLTQSAGGSTTMQEHNTEQ